MREWLSRLGDWLRRDRLDGELGEELRFHRERLEEAARAAGRDQPEAAWHARRQLGSELRTREAARDAWSWKWLDDLVSDTRHALRGLRRSPAFAATVILTLGLGIGANAAMFSVIDRLMLRPYPDLRDPASVHRVYVRFTERGVTRFTPRMPYPQYLDFRRWTSSFSQYAAFTTRTLAIGTGIAAREQPVGVVSASLFDFFDAPPALGRYFTAAEDTTPSGAAVAVLGYRYWKDAFAGRADAVGQVLLVGSTPLTIIGVAPDGFVGVSDSVPPALYLPLTTYAGAQVPQYDSGYWSEWLEMIVRRKPGVSLTQAAADLSAAELKSWRAKAAVLPIGPDSIAHPAAIAGAMRPGASPDPSLQTRTALWVSGVALIVLLIACANAANLFLSRALRRQRETAVRFALGVSRGRLARQALTESIALSLIGVAVGLVIAQWASAGMRHLWTDQPGLDVLTDWRTVSAAAVVALGSGLLTGLLPALFAGRGDLTAGLKAGAREGTYRRSRTRAALLITQGALSVVLLTGAGLFVRSLDHARSMWLGFDPDPVLIAERNMRGLKLDSAANARLGAELLAAAQALPAVEHAARVTTVPFEGAIGTGLFVPGVDSTQRLGMFTFQDLSPDYFATMGTRILRGRAFTAADKAGAPLVAVVEESMARVLWPGQDAIGQCMHVGSSDEPCTTVVGIAEDAVQRNLLGTGHYQYYLPIAQSDPPIGFGLLLRLRGDVGAQQEEVRRALQRVMPGESYITVKPLADLVDASRRSWQLGAAMFTAFGVLALLVAAIGIYGVIGYDVTARMHELGVRVALGAKSRHLLRLVVGQGLRVAATGVGLGLLLAWLLSRWVEPLLFHEPARDPAVYGIVAGVMLAVAVAASVPPALRAVRADPNDALRAE